MNNDPLIFVTLIMMIIFGIVIYYVIPVAGVITGAVLLKKKPNKKALGLSILIISSMACVAVAVWKIIEFSLYGI